MMANNKRKNNYTPGGQDVMLTPPHAIEPLLPLLDPEWRIWESATGNERLLENAFRAKGFSIYGTDLVHGDDYFEMPNSDYYDIEITNVPFSLKYQWLRKAFSRQKPFAFIVPYETTFSKDWQMMFYNYHKNPFEINVLSPERRINFKTPNMGWGKLVYDEVKGKEVKKGGSAQMPTSWVTWGLHPHTVYGPAALKTYYVPMRLATYDANNCEILK